MPDGNREEDRSDRARRTRGVSGTSSSDSRPLPTGALPSIETEDLPVTLLGNGVVVAGYSSDCTIRPQVIPGGAVVWQGERVLAVGPESQLRDAYPSAAFLNARGGLILPGLINLHHHFYSALARGLDPGRHLNNFAETLDCFWWRLDRALDPATVKVSAELSAAECIRWGCTTVFDHHSSPSCLSGSLGIIAEAVGKSGISAVLCYETSDRNGHQQALAGVEENLRFIRQQREHSRIRGTFGLHASFTLRDETLAQVAEHSSENAGCHIHTGEDPLDAQISRRVFGAGPIDRLKQFGLLNSRSLLAHGTHLEAEDYDQIAHGNAALIANPESNANNGVGSLEIARAKTRGCVVGLGTDGMSSAMLRSSRAAFLNQRARRANSSADSSDAESLLASNALVARRFFGEPLLGELAPGAPADITVVDSPPPTPIGTVNFFAHLVCGASEDPVRHTIARGKVLLEDFQHTTIDVEELAAHARELSPALWKRFGNLKWGTSFLGDWH